MNNAAKIWQQIREANHYFVNRNFLKYGVTDDNSDYTKRNKALWTFVPLLILVLLEAVVFAFTRMLVVSFVFLVIELVIYLWILRKFVFDEKNFKRLLSENQTHDEVGINGPLNNLLSINSDNEWFFQNDQHGLRSGFLVTFDYSSLLNLSLEASRTVTEHGLVPFVQELHANHFNFTRYDISLKSQVSLGTLKEIQQTKLLQKGSWLRLVEQLQNETLSSLEQNSSNTYKVFFLISNNDFKKLPHLKRIINSILLSTLSTQNAIVNPRIANTEEIINFIVNYYEISAFNPANIKRNVERMDVSKYFTFTGFYDTNGVRYQLEDFVPNSTQHNEYATRPLNQDYLNQLARNEQNHQEKQAKAKKQADINKQRHILERLRAEEKSNKPNQDVGIYDEKYFDSNAVLKKQNAERNKLLKQKQQEHNKQKLQEANDMKNLGGNKNMTLNDLINRAQNKHKK